MHEVQILGYLGAAILVFIFYAAVIKCMALCSSRSNIQRQSNNQIPSFSAQTRAQLPELAQIQHQQGSSINEVAGEFIAVGNDHMKQEGSLNFGHCTICISEVEDGQLLWQLPSCNHRFHADCIQKWLNKNKSCPLCRTSVHV